ncbi:zinc-binding dehydrogenase [Duganella callida]|uniref:Alcohol dehydrogenase n=1 Tax=Duganella callida TaxID=2561932 RepID=A0A4Y9SA74_9BURK|nr:zinc-binding dehydrogenase [Duganella callida]TFW18686.1 alcohol dehydrogenase [Duganella callida]
MLSIIHRKLGAPANVLERVDAPATGEPGPGQLRIRVAYVTVHPGDLQIIEGAPASGGPYAVSPEGRTPGFEGVGFITSIGPGIDAALGLHIGKAVAYFPVASGWSEYVLASSDAVVPVPDHVQLEIAAQALINTVTAELIIRAGHAAWPAGQRDAVTVIQTGAASAVGKIITALLTERGVQVIRLVRSAASARRLRENVDIGPVIATEEVGWEKSLAQAAAGVQLHVAVDGVGGPVLPVIADLLAPGGTIINYGSLGGATTDIRLLVPRGLTIQGVHIGQWMAQSGTQKTTDLDTAMRLAANRPDLFPVAAVYGPNHIKQAIEHVRQDGRDGAVLLTFQGENS